MGFLDRLFENDNFPIYLGIIIAILLAAFCIVFFLGKKDQKKQEQTRKLQLQDANLLAQTNQAVAVEVPAPSSAPVQTQVAPANNTYTASNAPSEYQYTNAQTVNQSIPQTQVPSAKENYTSLLDSIEKEIQSLEKLEKLYDSSFEKQMEEKASKFEELEKIIPQETIIKSNVLENKYEDLVKEFERLEQEEIKEKEASKTKVVDVFSSVYVPEKEEIDVINEDLTVELPKLIETEYIEDKTIQLPKLKHGAIFKDSEDTTLKI